MKHLQDFRFLDPAVQKCPYELNKVLRREAPVWLEPETGFYLVSRYDLIREVKKNPTLFSNDFNANTGQNTPPEALEILKRGRDRPQTLHRTDPPVHTGHRKVIDRTFTLARVKKMTPYIEGVVRDLMDEFPENGEIEFMKQYAIRLPCIILADQLGVPREHALNFKVWSDALLDPVGLMVSREREIECAQLTLEFQNFFAERIDERRASPKDDILTDLSQRMAGENPLSVEQVLNILEQIVTGGNESTTGLLGSALLMLIRNPDQEQKLRDDPSRIPNFVEEALRLECPVQSNFRTVTADTVLGGVEIPKGASVVLRYGAANRDEAQFEDSEHLDVGRANARTHLAFGHGIHTCPGAMLAREETMTTFAELLRRYRRFELLTDADSLQYHPTFFLRGLKSLPVRLVR